MGLTMKRAAVRCIAVAVMLLAVAVIAEAQQPKKVPRIGFLSLASASSMSVRVEPFRDGLRDHGYVEGKNIFIEFRYADGKRDRLSELAAELVRIKVDVIVTGGSGATLAAKEATNTVPIVMTQDGNPIAAKVVASLARPGGNVTGLSSLGPEMGGKLLELLKEILPKLSRVAVLVDRTNPDNAQALKDTEVAAQGFAVRLQYLEVRNLKDIEIAFEAANKEGADAILTQGGAVVTSHQTQIADLAIKKRLPIISVQSLNVTLGRGLMSYGPNFGDLYRRAATYVDKILKGANPADLPVEQPRKFEMVINLKTAKQIGLMIPQTVLYRADKVIR